MKIYASAPVENRDSLNTFLGLLKHLKNKGHNVVDLYSGEKHPIPTEINYHVEKYKLSEKEIRNSEVVMIEVSYPGRRIGYEIARALDEKKVVIALYKSGSKPRVSSIIGNQSKNFILQEYSEENIIDKAESALSEAKQKLDTKFILIISPEIDRYLEWCGDNRRMHKAQVVRTAVEDMMSKDKEYKESLKSAGV